MTGLFYKKPGPNPYVGPRPLKLGEPLFGRDAEVRSLFHLLNAERIVLLYSPSGGGKSSLVEAGLRPILKREGFDVWPTIRVNAEPLAGFAGNRYVSSTIASLEEELPKNLRRDMDSLASCDLKQYMTARPRRKRAPSSVMLFFDQFEEVLTTDPLALKAKDQFFTQVGDLLCDRSVWALFAIREDYLAPLDPYAPLVPTQFRNRFRLDLLGRDAACEAIKKPAHAAGREFAEADPHGVAEELVQELATVLVQQVDGSLTPEVGPTVEPVHLQVVCQRLWNQMPADRRVVGFEDLRGYGDVNKALGLLHGVRRVGRLARRESREVDSRVVQ